MDITPPKIILVPDPTKMDEEMDEEKNAPDFFLESVPTELFDTMLRFQSRMQEAKAWEMHIEVRDFSKLLAVRGELGMFMKSRFDTLIICSTKDCHYENWIYGWKLRTEPHLWTTSIDDAHEFILAGGGQSLRTLVVGKGMYEIDEDGEELVHDFLNYCPNVKSLSIHGDGTYAWVDLFGKQLEKLEVSAEMPFNFPLYSTCLREFTLYTNSEHIISANLWGRIGYSLERLVISTECGAANEFDEIKLQCRNLKSIAISSIVERDIAAIAELLISYGDKLEYAKLPNMNEDQLREVAEACPNARFKLYHFEGNFPGAALNTVGPKLDSIHVCHSYSGGYDATFKDAWSQCCNIRELFIDRCNLEDFGPIFSTPKAFLTVLKLKLRLCREAEDIKKAIDTCAKGTTGVEKFLFLGKEIYRDSLKNFLEANKGSLSSVIIEWASLGDDEDLDELLNCLLELPALEELVLDCEMPPDVLETLVRRGIYWTRTLAPSQ